MKAAHRDPRSCAGFTLAELLVGMAVFAMAMSVLVVASVAMQKSLWSARGYSAALNAQVRIADYIRRDLRNALDVAVLGGGTQLQIDLPADYAPAGIPVDPAVTAARTVVYGAPGDRVRVTYSLNGADFVRQAGGVQVVLAENVADFQPVFSPLLAGTTLRAVRLDLTYAGRFGMGALTDADGRSATILSTEMALRNALSPLPVGSTPPPVITMTGRRTGR